MPPKKRKSPEEDGEEEEPQRRECITLDFKVDPVVVRKILRSEYFIEKVWWSTKSCLFKLIDELADKPQSEPQTLSIKYDREIGPDGNNIGRLLSQTVDINGMYKPVKQAFLKDYFDIDIQSCHVSLIVFVNKSMAVNNQMPTLEKLAYQKAGCIEEVVQAYNVTPDEAKQYLTALLYGQRPDSFYKQHKIVHSKRIEIDLVKNIRSEIQQFIKVLNDRQYLKVYLDHVDKKNKKAEKGDGNRIYQALSYFLQSLECTELLRVITHIVHATDKNSGGLKPIIVPAHDGFYIHMDTVHLLTEGKGIDTLLQIIHDTMPSDQKPFIKYVHKPMTCKEIDIDDVICVDLYDNSSLRSHITYQLAAEITRNHKILKYNGKKYIWNGYIWSCDLEKNKSLIADKAKQTVDRILELSRYFYDGCPSTFDVYDKETKTIKKVKTIWAKKRDDWVVALKMYYAGSPYRDLIDTVYNQVAREAPSNTFDTHPYIFCFTNIYYDLKTQTFMDPDPDKYMSICTEYPYDEPEDLEKREGEIAEFFDDIMDDPVERQNLIWWCGTGLMGEHHQHFFICQGEGSNGKSVLSGLMRYLLGCYYYTMSSAALYAKESTGPNEMLYNADRKRYIVVAEPSTKREEQINISRLKEWTGSNTVSTRGSYQSQGDIKMHGSLTFECNQLPNFPDHDEGFNRRLLLTSFNSKFTDNVPHWQVEYQKQNLPITRVKQANVHYTTDEYQISMRAAMFSFLTKHIVKFLENGKKFLPSRNPLCQSYRNQSVSDKDPDTTFIGWFRMHFVYVHDFIIEGKPTADDQLNELFKYADMVGEKREWLGIDDPLTLLDVYSTPVKHIYKLYKESYHGQDSFKSKKELEIAIAGMAGIKEFFVPRKSPATWGRHALCYKTMKRFLEKYTVHKDAYNKTYHDRAVRDDSVSRIMHYIPLTSGGTLSSNASAYNKKRLQQLEEMHSKLLHQQEPDCSQSSAPRVCVPPQDDLESSISTVCSMKRNK
jgi:hypothetical protein